MARDRTEHATESSELLAAVGVPDSRNSAAQPNAMMPSQNIKVKKKKSKSTWSDGPSAHKTGDVANIVPIDVDHGGEEAATAKKQKKEKRGQRDGH